MRRMKENGRGGEVSRFDANGDRIPDENLTAAYAYEQECCSDCVRPGRAKKRGKEGK